jgi:hypothetical protein
MCCRIGPGGDPGFDRYLGRQARPNRCDTRESVTLPGLGGASLRYPAALVPWLLTRGGSGLLYLTPLDVAVLEGLSLLGVATLDAEQERLAREIAEMMLREAEAMVDA